MKIQMTEEVRRFNAQVELADIALGREFDRVDFLKLPSLLRANGHHELAGTLAESGALLGYFQKIAASQQTKSPCDHNNLCYDSSTGDVLCSDCGDIRLEADQKNYQYWREFIKNDARPGDIANVILKRDQLMDACKTALDNLKPLYSSDHLVIKKLTEALAL